MSEPNPYAYGAAVPAAQAEVADRARFLQRTYTWLLGGILAFCATLWACDNVPAVQSFVLSVFANPWIPLLLLFGAAFLVHAVAEKSPINAIAYGGYAFLFGVLVYPVVAIAGPALATQASVITAIVFVGLTAYVFISGRDFAFLRGVLFTALFVLIAIAIGGMLFGFNVGIWYSGAAALLFAGFILYDTSQILIRYPTTAHVTAAVVLFTDVVILFKHILILLMASRD